MSRTVRIWIIAGLVIGLAIGALIGTAVGENTLIGWLVISGIGGLMFFGLWGYASEQNKKVRRPEMYKE